MFTRIIDTLRNNNNNNNNNRYRDIPEINVERRSSMDEDHVNNTNFSAKQQNTPTDSMTSSPTTTTTTTTTTHDMSPTTPTTTTGIGAIGIKNDGLSDTVVYPNGRRRSSLFGYSTNAADDYMQKDLLSSSWS